jgi:DNA invertase Pin-like site-specific DNA recombinase
MKCYGYCRVSTDGQVEGVSLDAQRGRIQAYLTMRGFELTDVFVDEGISGKSVDNRPGLESAMAHVCENSGLLVVYSISRLGRNTRDIIEIVDRINGCGGDFVSVSESFDTTTASGKMIFRLMAVLAEFERDQLIERTRSSIEHKKSRGEVVGTLPYGFTRDGKVLVPDVAESVVLLLMLAWHEDNVSYAEIARMLDTRGFRPRSGGKWDRGVVRRILKLSTSDAGRSLRESHDLLTPSETDALSAL